MQTEKFLTPAFRFASLPKFHLIKEVFIMGEHIASIEKSIAYINEHLNEDLSPECLANQAGYSMFHFCRMFKEVTGESVMRFVRGKRLALAENAIMEGSALSEVAEQCGYETTSGFTRAYKKQFGYRPKRTI